MVIYPMEKYTYLLASDEELIKSFQRDGNEIALRQLIEKHKNAIYTNIFYTVKDYYIADEIFQETFIKIFKQLKKANYKEQGKFLPWAQRIASNLCIDHFRKVKRNRNYLVTNGEEILTFIPLPDSYNKEKELIQKEKSQILQNLLHLLPKEQKEVIILRIYGEFSFKEIAKITNVSINTALGRMRYGLQNLRKEINEKKIAIR